MTTTKSEMPTTATDPEIVAHYEDLRRQAMHPTDRMHRGTGFVLFVRRGMRDWMEAWLRCSPSVPAMPQTMTGLEQPSPIHRSRELVLILASMALGSRQEAKR